MLKTKMAQSWRSNCEGLFVWAACAMGTVLFCGTLVGEVRELCTHTRDFTINVWRVEEGLPQISVTSIAQTPEGYLWLSTFNGLARFDGVRFVVFDHGNTPALASSRISRLDVDREGGLWVMTEAGGVLRMAGGAFTVCRTEDGPAQPEAAVIASDSHGRRLGIDREGRLHRIVNGEWWPLKSGDSLPAQGEQSFLFDVNGRTWVVQGGKAVRSENRTVTLPPGTGADAPLADAVVQCGVRSAAGGYWLATRTHLCKFNGGRLDHRIILPPDMPLALQTMTEDAQGGLWFGSAGEGLMQLSRDGHWRRFGIESGLADDHITALLCDREGNVWVGTGGGGLHRFKPRRIQTYDTRDGLSGNTVMSVSEDDEGRIWIGVNGGGVNCYKGVQMGPVSEPAPLQLRQLVYSVLADSQGGIWIGLYGRGALRLHAGEVTGFTFEEGFRRATPLAIFEDHEGRIWLGGESGLQRYCAGEWSLYTRQDGLSHDEVRALAEDRTGTLYIGTHGGGLNLMRDGHFTCCTTKDGLADNHIAALWVDGDDVLWIGTVTGGLSRFKLGRFSAVTVKDGLASNTIGAICEDGLGYLWLGSNRGLHRVCKRELNEHLDGRRRGVACLVFDRSDGLNGIDCSGGAQPACLKSREGKLYFATVDGVAVVDPKTLSLNPIPPPVVIEELTVNDKTIAVRPGMSPGNARAAGSVFVRASGSGTAFAREDGQGQRLIVPPGKVRLGFRFTGLSLMASEKTRFRYRLAGFEEKWVEAGSQRTAQYVHVPPGEFLFEVTACNNDGVWNDSGASLLVEVLPWFWQTDWFRALAVVGLIGGTSWGLSRLSAWRIRDRLQNVERQYAIERERARIAQDIHDDVGSRLTQIGLLTELAMRGPDKSGGMQSCLGRIAEQTRSTVLAMDEIVWTVDPKKDTVEGLLNYITSWCQEYFQGSHIRCLIDIPLVLPPRPISTKARHNLMLAVKEVLNNCLKHSRASEVWIRVRIDGSRLDLQIEDNGCGFGPDDLSRSDGHGLRNMRDRISGIEGTCDVASQAGQGTKIQMHLDLSKHTT